MPTAELDDALGVRTLYTPHRPTPPQHAFLWLNREEALYGGAAGGGKSDALLAAALQYVDVPRYAAILFRRTFTDLDLPGALIPRSREWLAGTDAIWNDVKHRWTFPSGATLSFGFLATSRDKYRYQGAEFQFVGFDELTQFAEDDFTYLFSRLRRPALVDERTGEPLKLEEDERRIREALARVPLRMRGATNPGGRGHAWVKRRFVLRRPNPLDPEDTPAKARARVFIPAKLEDNPYVDREGYERNLANLTELERKRLRDGDWDADLGDRYFSGIGIDAAVALGQEFARDLELDRAPPPAGGLLALGIDWGDRTGYVIGWPLEAGGMHLAAGELLRGEQTEPAAAARRMFARLGTVPAWPGVGKIKDPLELLSDVRYDAAGLQSQKTFNAVARQRRPRLRATKVPFNQFKRESGQYARLLFERARDGHRTRVISIGPDVDELVIDQFRNLRRDPADEELPLKPERDADDADRDEGPDATLALLAPVARSNRAR